MLAVEAIVRSLSLYYQSFIYILGEQENEVNVQGIYTENCRENRQRVYMTVASLLTLISRRALHSRETL